MVTTHYLCYSWVFSTEIRNIDVSQEYTGQVQIWFLSNYFQLWYAPCTYAFWCQTTYYESHITLLYPSGGIRVESTRF